MTLDQLRDALYAAIQTLSPEQLEEFWQMIDDLLALRAQANPPTDSIG